METTSLRFAAAARALGSAARRAGLRAPGFRSPPRRHDIDRSLRRRADGGAMVAIRLRGRPWAAVISDMVEGVIATNALKGPDADRARTTLWQSLEAESLLPAAVSDPATAPRPSALPPPPPPPPPPPAPPPPPPANEGQPRPSGRPASGVRRRGDTRVALPRRSRSEAA